MRMLCVRVYGDRHVCVYVFASMSACTSPHCTLKGFATPPPPPQVWGVCMRAGSAAQSPEAAHRCAAVVPGRALSVAGSELASELKHKKTAQTRRATSVCIRGFLRMLTRRGKLASCLGLLGASDTRIVCPIISVSDLDIPAFLAQHTWSPASLSVRAGR